MRIDGYLCIDGCERILADKDKHQYWVIINNEEYYFKPAEFPHHELISYYAAKMLGINACYCDLAILNGEVGVISKSLRNDNYKLISGDILLDEYLASSIESIGQMGLSKGMINMIEIGSVEGGYSYSEQVNNLEIIWQCLEYKYKNKVDIKKIMKQFILMYFFTIIFHDVDKHPGNWMIIEDNDNIELAPLFDNERIFNDYCCGVNLSTNFNDSGDDTCSSLKEFFKISSLEYFDLFLEVYDKIVNNFEYVLCLVEKQIDGKIPSLERRRARYMFNKNCLKIDEVLKSQSSKKLIKK